MGSFRRAFLGYRRAEVDAAIDARDARVGELEREMLAMSEMLLGREREIDGLRESLREANARHDRSLNALQTVAMRVEEIHAQARGQATRIRMQALHDAVEISGKVQEIADRLAIQDRATNGADPIAHNGAEARSAPELFEGLVEVEIGPLGDFSQLVGFEDAAANIGATSEISVRKFSEGRATLSMRLNEPVELLRELEQRSPMEFRVRRTDDDRVVLDLDDEAEAA
jgi:cell division septum initiation protein DivIVA